MCAGRDDGAVSGEVFPAYCYTIGLAEQGLPELIIVGPDMRMGYEPHIGLDPHVAIEAADGIIRRALADNKAAASSPFTMNTVLHDVFKGTRAMLVHVPTDQANHRALFALDYAVATSTSLQAIQLLWPDRDGRLPFEDGVTLAFAENQPVLKYLPPPHPEPAELPVMQ
jgi:hypothetical protein